MKVVVRCSRRDRLPELRYVLDVFASARCRTWEFVHAGDEPGDGDLRLNYGREVYDDRPGSINVPCAEGPVVAEYARYAPGSVPFLVSTRDHSHPGPGRVMIEETGSRRPLIVADASRHSVTFGFDVIANIFWHLSCALEYEYERRHAPVHSYAYRVGFALGATGVPVVNHYFTALEQAIAEATGRRRETIVAPVRYPQGGSFAICLTHDVDAVARTWPLRIKRLAFDAYHLARGTGAGRRVHGRLAWQRLAGSGEYWHFDRIAALESTFGWRSSYFVYAREDIERGSAWRRVVFDPGYDVARCHRLKTTLRDRSRAGDEIALHGSYESHASMPRLAAQKSLLESVVGRAVHGNRQHWLRFSLAETWPIHETIGFTYDATLGFNDVPGFRAGVAGPFHPWDHRARRGLRLVAIPTAVMDSTLFDYLGLSPAEAEHCALTVLEEVAACGGAVAINWHQQAFGDDYGWGGTYRRLLEWIQRRGGVGLTCGELVDAFRR